MAVLSVLAVSAAACGGGDNGAGPPPAVTTAVTDTTARPAGSTDTRPAAAAVPEIVDFVAPAVGGGEIDVGALATRPLALWFWAPT